MQKHKVLIILFVLFLLAAGYFFKDNFLRAYDILGRNLENFQSKDLGTIISEVGKEIFTPSPLRIGGNPNSSVFSKESIVTQTNAQRQANGGLPTLLISAKLNAAAKAKAEDMFAKQYFEHVSPDGIDPGTLVRSHGYEYIVTGENLIMGNFKDEKEIVQLWMDSPGHRANILNNRFSQIGVAIIKGEFKGDTVWIGVQEFGLPISACSQPDTAIKNQIEANKASLDILAVKIEDKRQEIERTNRRSESYNQLVDQYNAMVAEYNILNDKTKTLIAEYNGQVNQFNQCVSGS